MDVSRTVYARTERVCTFQMKSMVTGLINLLGVPSFNGPSLTMMESHFGQLGLMRRRLEGQ